MPQAFVRLRGVSPPVWRRLIVPAHSTIAELHLVIQAATGWEDIHFHRLEIRGESYDVSRLGSLGFRTNADEVQLSAFAFRERERFSYIYDFSSSWWHDIRVEHVGQPSRGPRCMGGRGACPPEGSGGPRLYLVGLREHDPSQLVCDVAELLDEETMTDEDRYGRRSTMVTSQLPVASWFDLIGNPTYADAILDRLVHNAHRLELSGESMRRNHATAVA